MRKAISLLRGDLLAALRLDKALARLETALKKGKGDEAGRISAEIERLLIDFDGRQREKDKLFAEQKADGWEQLIAAMPPSGAKAAAEELRQKLADRLKKLKKRGRISRALLDRDVDYSNYTLNVVTGASAGTTYSAEADQPGAGRAVDMFNASV